MAQEPSDIARSAVMESNVRFEHVAQDGRPKIDALLLAIEESGWGGLLRHLKFPIGLRKHGLYPILAKIHAKSTDASIRARGTLSSVSNVELGYTPDKGQGRRELMRIHTDVRGTSGRTHGAKPEDEGQAVEIGQLTTEYVWTKLFAEPGQRRVHTLPETDFEGVPRGPLQWSAPESLLQLAADEQALESELSPDSAVTRVGLTHTDANHHVNSFVYPRLFEEAALRRLAGLGRATPDLLVREAHFAFQRPGLVGMELQVRARAFERDGRLGVVCVMENRLEEKPLPRVVGRLIF
ncbi:MAG: hypothetical protein HRU17_15010 [Polyangiaceae bacterium]|nr:hypothetical protein [Polyangiaceae bacterium]